MAGQNIAVFGIYPHRASFEYALGVLKQEGFRNTDVSVLVQENSGTKDLVTEEGTGRRSNWCRFGSSYRRRTWLVDWNWRASNSRPRIIFSCGATRRGTGGNWSRKHARWAFGRTAGAKNA